jgi:hypothetical protein
VLLSIVKIWFVFCNSLISSSFNTFAVIMLQFAPYPAEI